MRRLPEGSRGDPELPIPPPGLERIACGPEVVAPVRTLVHGLKYSGHRAAAPELVEIAWECADAGICTSDSVLVPVPLHPTRERERGYNQSQLLAREWSARWNVPIGKRWLVRNRSTGTQTRLGSGDRRRNLEGAFSVGPGFKPGVPVVVVDDVLTTGATLSACAAALLAAGAPSVRGVCVAWAGDA